MKEHSEIEAQASDQEAQDHDGFTIEAVKALLEGLKNASSEERRYRTFDEKTFRTVEYKTIAEAASAFRCHPDRLSRWQRSVGPGETWEDCEPPKNYRGAFERQGPEFLAQMIAAVKAANAQRHADELGLRENGLHSSEWSGIVQIAESLLANAQQRNYFLAVADIFQLCDAMRLCIAIAQFDASEED